MMRPAENNILRTRRNGGNGRRDEAQNEGLSFCSVTSGTREKPVRLNDGGGRTGEATAIPPEEVSVTKITAKSIEMLTLASVCLALLAQGQPAKPDDMKRYDQGAAASAGSQSRHGRELGWLPSGSANC